MPWDGHEAGEEFVCLECSATDSPLDWIDSWGSYDRGLVEVVQAFKFRGHDFLDQPLADLIADAYAARNDDDFDTIVAVPMHRKKVRARGYNQAELLARRFSRRTRIPLRSELLQKIAETQTQSSLEKSARAANVRHAFAADREAKGRAVLLIDDICTTGETLTACARALRRAGARRVSALTVARAT
jgi:ComF family protein